MTQKAITSIWTQISSSSSSLQSVRNRSIGIIGDYQWRVFFYTPLQLRAYWYCFPFFFIISFNSPPSSMFFNFLFDSIESLEELGNWRSAVIIRFYHPRNLCVIIIFVSAAIILQTASAHFFPILQRIPSSKKLLRYPNNSYMKIPLLVLAVVLNTLISTWLKYLLIPEYVQNMEYMINVPLYSHCT